MKWLFLFYISEYETGVAYTDFNESEILERIKEGKERKKKNFDSWNHSISCPICGKKVAHRNNLKRHILRRHNESDLAIIGKFLCIIQFPLFSNNFCYILGNNKN